MGHGAKVHAHTTDADMGFREIEKQIKIMRQNPYVMVGVLEGSGNVEAASGENPTKSAITVATLASIHEYGAPKRNIPERSFIRTTMDEKYSTFNELTDHLIDAIVEGGSTVERALNILGLLIQTEIKKKIRSNIAPPLKLATIERKNKAQIDKAKSRVTSITKTGMDRGYRSAQKASGVHGPLQAGSYRAVLTDKEKQSLNSAALKIMTGGSSTALIDTGQLINSIQYKTILENAGYSDEHEGGGEVSSD